MFNKSVWMIFFCLAMPLSAYAAPTFKGSFSSVESSGGVCDEIFLQKEYVTKHFLVGPDYTISVLYFEKSEVPGFFSEMNLIGRLGYNGDIYAVKEVNRDGLTYKVVSDGIVDYELLLTEITVSVVSGEEEVCTTKGEYLGFLVEGE